MCWNSELDYACGYFSVFPGGFAHLRDPEWPEDEPFLFILPDCPPEIKERLLVDWPRIVKETKERRKKCSTISSKEFF